MTGYQLWCRQQDADGYSQGKWVMAGLFGTVEGARDEGRQLLRDHEIVEFQIVRVEVV